MQTREGDVSDADDFDYGEDAAIAPTAVDEAFAQLDKYVIEVEKLDVTLAKLEAETLTAEALRKRHVEQLIPELMKSMRLDKVTTRTGVTVEIKQDIRCTLPGADDRPDVRAAAIQWLIDSGNGGVVKNMISVALDKGEDERAVELAADLLEKGFAPEVKKDVHAGTLGALVRELLTDGGKPFPKHLFNFFDQTVALLARGATKIGKARKGKGKK